MRRSPVAAVLGGAVLAAPSPAFAYHDTIGVPAGGGGMPLEVILPIAGAVVVGAVALAIWGRAPGRKARRRKRPQSVSYKAKKAKRGR